MKKKLGVSIDHIAILRQEVGTSYPEPLQAAYLIQNAGASAITMHPREDQRHIQKRDLYLIREACSMPLNMEMDLYDDIVNIALDLCPEMVCIIPENRREMASRDRGLDLLDIQSKLDTFISQAQSRNIDVSLFINHDDESIKLASELGVDTVELNTSVFGETTVRKEQEYILEELKHASQYAFSLGLQVNAGYGLNYDNTALITTIPEIHTLNLGHTIIARALFVGLDRAVKDMLTILSHH